VRQDFGDFAVAQLRPRQIPSRQLAASEHRAIDLWMRGGLFAFSAALCLGGAWIMAAELVRSVVPYFPSNADATSAARASQAAAAARIGWRRGDLWLDDALLRWSEISPVEDSARQQPAEMYEAVRAVATRAIRLAPHDSRSWLVLSAANAALGKDFGAALKMSYYTGPHELALIPLRIRLAVRGELGQDRELTSLVQGELQTIIDTPGLMPSLVSAYRSASADNRRAVDALLGELAPSLMKDLQANPGAR
jgi:hypothetical protein